MSKTLLSRHVRAGVELLDRVLPGWPLSIDPDTLDVGSTDVCVAAQLSEFRDSYGDGIHRLILLAEEHGIPVMTNEDRFATAHGFDRPREIGRLTPRPSVLRDYDTLTRMWATVVRSRLGVSA